MIPRITDAYPGSYLREIVTSLTPGWSAHNPSIAQGPDGEYRCIVRSASYVFRDGAFLPTQPDGVVRTVNFLCALDQKLNVTEMLRIDDSEVDQDVYPWVRGLEDARLFWYDGDWYSAGTLLQHDPNGIPKIALDHLVGNRVMSRRILPGPDPERCEKNWMPILRSSPMQFVYGVDPPTIIDAFGDFREGAPVGTPATLRGGTQVLSVNCGDYPEIWGIALTHEVTWEPHRKYWHRFVSFDVRGTTNGWSEPFYFIDHGCEFAAGIVEWGDNYAVSFGTGEERAMLAIVPKTLALESITPAPG
jgi:hypothetical protein